MSVAFTNPYSAPTGQLWQTLLNEITLAYDERRQVINQSAYLPTWAPGATFASGARCRYGTSPLMGVRFWESLQDANIGHLPDEAGSAWWKPATVADVQAASYWETLQAWLETNCVFREGNWWEPPLISFVDYTGPLNVGKTDFLYFTLATWRAAAGLNPSGFRRSTDNGSTFLYGQMQRGDHIGPWIFEDLQNGFSALQWTKKDGGLDSIEMKAASSAAAFATAPWVADPWEGAEIYGVRYRASYWYCARVRGKATLSSVPIVVPHTAHVYILPIHDPYFSWYNYADLDSYGMTQDEIWLFEEFASSSSDSHITDYLGNIDTPPLFNITASDALWSSVKGWILKWGFTNQG